MKKFIIIFVGLALMASSCKSKKRASPKTEKVKVSAVDMADVEVSQKNKAYELGKRILMTCNTSKSKPFNSNEATDDVIKNTTQERLTQTCLKFRLKYGDFKDLKLVEVVRNKKDDTNIYRYKAVYEKKIANKELRVTMNDNNQVTAIKSKDWTDKF